MRNREKWFHTSIRVVSLFTHSVTRLLSHSLIYSHSLIHATYSRSWTVNRFSLRTTALCVGVIVDAPIFRRTIRAKNRGVRKKQRDRVSVWCVRTQRNNKDRSAGENKLRKRRKDWRWEVSPHLEKELQHSETFLAQSCPNFTTDSSVSTIMKGTTAV